MQITEEKLSGEQGGFRRGKSCVDQIFAIKMFIDKYLEKDWKLYVTFID